MLRFRTDTCVESGHREFTVLLDEAAAPAVDMLLDHLQNAVAARQSLTPGQSLQIGSAVLRVIERDDGTFGLEERTGPDSWAEHVHRCLEQTRYQVLAAEQLGVPERLDFPVDTAVVQFQPCGLAGAVVHLFRKTLDDPRHSGWYVLCIDEHDHDEWTQSDILELTQSRPFVTPFLALPAGLTLQVARPGLGSAGKVRAHVWRDDEELLTPDGGGLFDGPISAAETALADRRRPIAWSIIKTADRCYRTSVGARSDHPEFTVRFAEQPLVSGAEAFVLDYLQDAMAGGTRFEPGQTIGVGSAALRVTARDDGTLGLEEQLDPDRWAEQIDSTVRDTWSQKEVAASLGLVRQLRFPSKHQQASVAQCVTDHTPTKLVLHRRASDAPHSSGWMVSCGESHLHGTWVDHTLFELARALPFAVQFLALPDKVTVVVESPTVTSSGRIHAQVMFNGRRLIPEPGSYLDAVNA
jgi:hypothetical protein